MNRLLKISFDRYGYDYDFLKGIHETMYKGKYLFQGEADMLIRLERIRKDGSKLVILPDFDMDGISAGAILYAGLSLLGFDCELYAPDTGNGYGFGKGDIDNILASWPDTAAIITCDVGITCRDAVAYAGSKGVTMLVTDHHPEIEGLAINADAIVDPSRIGSDCKFTGVCGAYVAYHLLETYAKMLDNAAISALISKLSIFAAFGSCGDLMPVLYDTRDIIIAGLEEFEKLLSADDLDGYFGCDPVNLPDVYAAAFENMRRLHFWLVKTENIKPGYPDDVDLGFTYCPMFNSVKRMGGSMLELYSLLYTRDDPDFEDKAAWLWDLNIKRKSVVAEEYARLMADPRQKYAPYIYLSDCEYAGVYGLLAMKIMQSTGLPCFVLGRNDRKGSGRLPDFISREIMEFDGVSMQGHSGAFGAHISAKALPRYYKYLTEAIPAEIESVMADPDRIADPRPVIAFGGHACYDPDYDFSLSTNADYDTCFDYAMQLSKFRPFGRGFEEPEHIFELTRRDISAIKTMGSDKSHLRIELPFNIRMVFFGGVSRCLEKIENENDPDCIYKFSGRFSINEYNGNRSLQFMISDML